MVEYTLLMAAIVLACGWIVMQVGNQSAGIWTIVNSRLGAANNAGS